MKKEQMMPTPAAEMKNSEKAMKQKVVKSKKGKIKSIADLKAAAAAFPKKGY